ncbi:MAG: T9SS type A sorting domain-containing protein [Bacteroidales bacterium]|nr:T9SS type A sorting domain-containing protein [Bacteroidales bacterium]
MKQIFFITSIIALISNSSISQVSFQEYPLGEPAQRVTGIVSADFDLDGDFDIITCLRTENKIISYTKIVGEFPAFTTSIIADNIQGPFYICAGDLNQDDYQDIVVSLIGSNKIIALLNPGSLNQNWPMYIVTENFNGPHGVAIADINGNGLNDIIGNAADDNTIAFWQNNGENPDTWTKTIIANNFSYTQAIDVIDFDDDGDIDLVASALQANTIALWINDGAVTPNFEKIIITNSFSMAHDAVFGDANGDSLTDIFGAAYGSNQIACWLNSGGNPVSFSKIIIDNNFSGALTVRTGDIDNDGDLDAAGCAWGNGTVAWFENKMNITAGWEKHIITEDLHGAWPLCLADFEEDNDIDILAGADKLNNPGTNGTFTLWENLFYTTGIKVKEKETEIKIFPNPCLNILNIIEGKERERKYISIFNQNGQLIECYLSAEKCSQIRIGSLNKGLYIIKIENNNGRTSYTKFIKLI